MSIDAKSGGVPQSVGLLFRDLPRLVWALLLLIGSVAYVALKARRRQ
jgi:hypothetical protein